jgi:lipopolysaccharide/colanic/teichoic acid biosynthesis glycosyltransferase
MAILLMLMLSPLFLIIALAIWLETRSQPIFRQTRIGRNNEPFVIYKFCTMIPDRRTANLPFEGKDRRKTHKSPNDPRVTRIGHFLRATSLDELPQLINIIRGDMSFIGPRPELPGIVRSYAPWQHQRHLVTPGLTGWWQIQGRSDLPMHEHTELDIYYVINFSWSLDLRIVLHTIAILLLRTGAF